MVSSLIKLKMKYIIRSKRPVLPGGLDGVRRVGNGRRRIVSCVCVCANFIISSAIGRSSQKEPIIVLYRKSPYGV